MRCLQITMAAFTMIVSMAMAHLEAAAAEERIPHSVVFERDIEYSNPDGQHLQLNMARPKDGKGPFPAVVCIHGGGFRAGTRESFNRLIDRLKASAVEAQLMTIDGADHGFRGATEEVKSQIEEARIAFFDKHLKRS